MSAEDYLRTEQESLFKREYVGGFVYPLHGSTPDRAGTTAAHNLIGGNIIAALHPAARRLERQIYAFSLKLYIESNGSFLYPDVMLTDHREVVGPDGLYVSNPCFLVEIISEASKFHDRANKYSLYTAIPSLQTYLMVEQTERRVYVYTRQGEKWAMHEQTGGNVQIACLDLELTLDDIYAGVL